VELPKAVFIVSAIHETKKRHDQPAKDNDRVQEKPVVNPRARSIPQYAEDAPPTKVNHPANAGAAR